MTITTPSAIQITPAAGLWLPAVSAEPLQTALENLNYLMRYHRPPLVSHAYTAEHALTRSSVYVVPVLPSADGLRYTFEHRFVCDTATQSVTVTVDETATYAGVGTTWANIYSQAVTTSGTGGNLTTHTKIDQTIAASTRALRITYTAPGVGARNDHHLLVHPQPGDPAAGIATSGATPFDDGAIVHAGRGAVHEEWLNRCKITTVALLQDRLQCALSFLQDESNQLWQWSAGSDTDFRSLPPVRVWLPNQGPTCALTIYALATVDAGATADLIRVRQTGNVQGAVALTLDATNAIVSGSLAVQTQGEGLMRYVDIEIGAKRTAGNKTQLKAVTGYYRPGD